jgi:tetratricopeptide (TPR) repeat protein
MKVLMVVLISLAFLTDPLKISKINSAKSEARRAYLAGEYKTAVDKYKYLIDSLGVKEDEIYLNLGNAYFIQNDTANAISAYQTVTASTDKELVSKAHQQLGVIANMQNKPEQALNDFKQAIKLDPANEEARYNYEMVKRKLDKQNQQNQKDKKDDKNKNQDKKPEPSEFAKRLKAEADGLVAGKRYQDAYNLMQDGLKKDQSVSAYDDYIKRIKDVADINR